MANKKGLIAFIIFIILGSFLLSMGEYQEKKVNPKKVNPKKVNPKKISLVRKDLLFTGNQNLKAPRRNIFSPTSAARAQAGTSLERARKKRQQAESAQKTERLENVNTRPSVNLRYIGYIRSENRIVALVLFRGEAWAVEKGELLDDEIKVENVSIQEIVLTLGGFQPLKFAIEGETQ